MPPKRLLAELFYDIRAKTTGLQSDLKLAETQFGKLTAFVKANPVAALTALGVALGSLAIKAIKAAAETESAMRQIKAAVPATKEEIDGLRQSMDDLGKASGRLNSDIASAAKEIAKLGAGSVDDVGKRLEAATLAADASGEELITTVQALDTVMDTFGLTSDDAAEALGKLFGAARGRASFAELADAIASANPKIRAAGINLDTTTRAITALIEEGRSARDIKRILGELDAPGITELANRIPPVVDGLKQMRDAADEVRTSTERSAERVKAKFGELLRDLGTRLLPLANAQLQGIIDGFERLDRLTGQAKKPPVTNPLDRDPALSKAATGIDPEEERKKAEAARKKKEEEDRKSTEQLIAANKRREQAQKDAIAAEKKLQADLVDARADFERLRTTQEGAGNEAVEAARGFDELIARFETLGTALPANRTEVLQTVGVLKSLRDEAVAIARSRLGDEIQELLASFTTTTVDDLELALKRLQDRLRQEGATDEQIAEIAKLEAAFIDVRKSSEDLDAALATGRRGGISAIKEMVGLLAKLEQSERDLQALESAGPEHDRERKELLEQIAKLKERIKELEEQTAEATGETEKKTKSLTSALSDALDVAFGIATALAGANDTLTKMIGSAASVAGGLESIAKLAKEAGGLKSLFSSGAGILSALPGIGQIIGGGAALAGLLFGDDPDEKANREATLKSVAAMKELSRQLGDLARIQQSGRVTAGVTTAVSSVNTSDGLFGAAKTLRDLQTELRRAGVTFEDFKAVAKDLGFDFERFTVEGFRAFQQALRDLDFAAFADTFAGQLSALEQRFRLFDIDAPGSQFEALIDLLNNPKTGAPALFGALDGLDVSTEAGRKQAKEVIQKLFQQLLDKSIDPDSLNGLSLDQFRDVLDRLFGLVDGVVDEVTSLLDKLNEAFNDIDLDLAIAGNTNPIVKAIKRAAAAVANDPRIAAALGGLDLANVEGRRAAIAALQKLAEGADKELKQVILELLDTIRAVPGTVGEGVDGEQVIVSNAARGLTETTGNRMADYLATANILQRDELDLLRDIRDQLALFVFGPPVDLIRPPTFSSSLGQASVSPSFTVVVHEGAFVVNTPANVTDQAALQDFLSGPLPTAFVKKVGEGLVRDARDSLKALGIVRQ